MLLGHASCVVRALISVVTINALTGAIAVITFIAGGAFIAIVAIQPGHRGVHTTGDNRAAIGGAGVARGYHNRDELTAEKFIKNPLFSYCVKFTNF